MLLLSISHFYFICKYGQTLKLLPLNLTYFNSPESNRACPLKKKSIETCKVLIILIKVPNSQRNHQCLKYATVFTSTCSRLPKYSIVILVFTIHTFIRDYRHMLWLLPLKMPHFNSPNPNLASPRKEKSIETCKPYIIVRTHLKIDAFVSDLQQFQSLKMTALGWFFELQY